MLKQTKKKYNKCIYPFFTRKEKKIIRNYLHQLRTQRKTNAKYKHQYLWCNKFVRSDRRTCLFKQRIDKYTLARQKYYYFM